MTCDVLVSSWPVTSHQVVIRPTKLDKWGKKWFLGPWSPDNPFDGHESGVDLSEKNVQNYPSVLEKVKVQSSGGKKHIHVKKLWNLLQY